MADRGPQLVLLALFGLFSALTLRDLLHLNGNSPASQPASPPTPPSHTTAPPGSLGGAPPLPDVLEQSPVAGPLPGKVIPPSRMDYLAASRINRVRIEYCGACGGYKRLFDQYADLLREKFPAGLAVEGVVHEGGPAARLLSRVISMVKFVLIGCLLASIPNPLAYLPGLQDVAPPGWWRWALEHKMYAVMFAYMLGNIMEGTVSSSGAFEVYLNDRLIFSKMASNRVPQPPELFASIESATGLLSGVQSGMGGNGFGPDRIIHTTPQDWSYQS